MNVTELVQLLCSAVDNQDEMPTLIRKFQRIVFDFPGTIGNETVDEVFRNLAMDLDYHERDRLWRSQDKSFIGSRRAKALIKKALSALEKMPGAPSLERF